MLKDRVLQQKQAEEEMYQIMSDIFSKCQDAGILREEYYEHGEEKWVSLKGYSFDGYEFFNNYVTLKGELYAGCGEYDYTHVDIPYDAFDNIDGWIAEQDAKHAEFVRKQAEAKAAKEAENKRQAEEAERKRFLELKEKYEGATK
jgi:hypothetical protein